MFVNSDIATIRVCAKQLFSTFTVMILYFRCHCINISHDIADYTQQIVVIILAFCTF